MPLTPEKGTRRLFQDLRNILSVKAGRAMNPALLTKKIKDLELAIEDTYSVDSESDLQDGIDTITDDAATFFIEAGTHVISTGIDLDSGGSVVIYGHGDNTVLQPAAGISVFNITSQVSVTIRDLKIDLSNYTASGTQGVIVNEGSNYPVKFENVTIVGDTTNKYGIGIELQSNNVTIDNCRITYVDKAIYINSSDNHVITKTTTSNCTQYGIHAATTNYTVMSNNTCSSNTKHGIYITGSDFCTITANTCNSNTQMGIYLSDCDNNTFSSNTCNSNSQNGIYVDTSDYNTISANSTNANDSNTANSQAGLYITNDSDFNTVSANSSNNNNNSGAGDGYGIIIDAATCNENVISANNANGNDVDYKDVGTDTTLEYYVQDATELQEAIDSIGAKNGIVHVNAGTTTLTAAIDVDGGGSIIIEGEGDNSIIDIGGDYSAFNITSVISCLLKNFKIDASDLTTATKEIINITESSNNRIIIDNVTITGDGTNGYGVEINSQKTIIRNCNIEQVNYGIHILSDYAIIQENFISNCATAGIYMNGADYCNISNNSSASNVINGIYITGSNNNTISSNTITSNQQNGIYITGSNNNTISSNTCIGNDSTTANPQAGIYITTTSLSNTISSNTSTNNNNSGAGSTYGVYIATATCTGNTISGNTCSGNDVNYWDNGVNTDITYLVSNATDLQDAIDSIAAKAGNIILNEGTITLTQAIDIDGGGSIIIEGSGDNSIIDINGDYSAFNITSAVSCTLKDFKIDASDLTTATKEIINVNESSNYRVSIENITITGDGTNGYGIELNSNKCRIENCDIDSVAIGINILSNNNRVNNCYIDSCASMGVQINGGLYNSINDNTMTACANGIYLQTSANNNYVNGNLINQNTLNGVFITGSNSNKVFNNTIDANDSTTANAQAGVYLETNCDYNVITSNIITDNNNSGAGSTYGVYIGNSNCDKNIIDDNTVSGNDVSVLDSGTNTNIIYYCYSVSDIQNAIDSIGTKSGHIKIPTGTYELSATIDIDGGGDYIIEGDGVGTILDEGGDWSVFNITSASSCIIKNLKIDATDLTAGGGILPIINVNEGSNNKVIIENIIITGDGTNGYGIELNSQNVVLSNNNISNINWGIRGVSNSSIIKNNIIYSNDYGIVLVGSYIIIEGNICYNNSTSGIGLIGASDCYIGNNICYNNTKYGIIISNSSNNNTIIGNICQGNNTNSATSGGGIIITTDSDNNNIIGNSLSDSVNIGAGTGYGIYIMLNTCDNNTVIGNTALGNDTNFLDSGTSTYYQTAAADQYNNIA